MAGQTRIELGDLTAAEVVAAFESTEPLTVGVEEEVMLLDPETLDLAPRASRLLGRLGGDPRFKSELPAAQIEITTAPSASATDALASLAAGRADLAVACEGLARPAVAAVHPFAAAEGELDSSPNYEVMRSEYEPVARRQLVAALQVHVALGDAVTTLAVYNALRARLPEIAALAANGAVFGGRDTGLASVRPKISETLPRQGLPPWIESWESFAAELRWGAAAEAVTGPRLWWWELRPHLGFGTLEVRVPDAQTTLADAGAVAAFVQALVAWLADADAEAVAKEPIPRWRIEENRWSAARHGIEGEMADLVTGDREPTRRRLHRLLDELAPVAERLGTARLLGRARALVEENGATRQREGLKRRGAQGLARQLADDFLAPPDAELFEE